MSDREQIINDYVNAYNQFDTERMVQDFHKDIIFENVSNGHIDLTISGIDAFKVQAEQAKSYFKQRLQTITSVKHYEATTEIYLDYSAIVAMDLPNGLKENEHVKLKGKSIFTFQSDKIVKLVDIS